MYKEIEKAVPADNIVIGTSCSLLHVPYTVGSEEKLSEEILRHFAFAEEKLTELSDIANGNGLQENKALFAKPRTEAASVHHKRTVFRREQIHGKVPSFFCRL